MKILHTVDSGGIYGKEQVVLNLLKEQKKQGHYVHLVVTGKPDLVIEAANRNISVSHVVNGKVLISTVLRQQDNFDVIHIHDRRDSIVFGALKAIGRLKTPLIRTTHGHTTINPPVFSKYRLYQLAEALMFRFHDRVIGVSDNMREFKTVDGIVPNGIEPFLPNHLSIPKKFWIFQSDNFTIMCSARLSTEKNLPNLIRAVNLLRLARDNNELKYHGGYPKMGIKLYIFGDGQQRQYLETLINKLDLTPDPENKKLDEVYLMGFNKNARDYLRCVDVYIQPSYTEGMPISVLEALCARRLTITSNVGGMATLINKGAVVGCDTNPISITKALIESSHIKHDEITEPGYQLFISKYSSEAMANGYLEVYNSVLKGKQ